MIPIVGYNEDIEQFPTVSIDMRLATSPLIEDRLKAVFGASKVVYVGRGFNNAHHRLSGTGGHLDLLTRRALFPIEALARRLEREYRVLEYLMKKGYPHAPRPIRRLIPGEIDACPGFVMTFIEGSNPDFEASAVRDLGVAVRLLHKLPVPDWLLGECSTTEPLRLLEKMWLAWRPKLETIRSTMLGVHLEKLEAVVSAVPGKVHSLDWRQTSAVLLHGDLGNHNLLREQHTARIVLLDWEFADVSDPVLDLMWLFNRSGFGELQRACFFEGYGNDIPDAWQEQLQVLPILCLVEDAIWAQSGIDDIKKGRNREYFQFGELEYLENMVARIQEVDIRKLRLTEAQHDYV